MLLLPFLPLPLLPPSLVMYMSCAGVVSPSSPLLSADSVTLHSFSICNNKNINKTEENMKKWWKIYREAVSIQAQPHTHKQKKRIDGGCRFNYSDMQKGRIAHYSLCLCVYALFSSLSSLFLASLSLYFPEAPPSQADSFGGSYAAASREMGHGLNILTLMATGFVVFYYIGSTMFPNNKIMVRRKQTQHTYRTVEFCICSSHCFC